MAKGDNSRQALSIEQGNAIELLVLGKSDREAAEAVGVARQTVNEWRNANPAFIAALNRRRLDLWAGHADKLRTLIDAALNVLQDDVTQESDYKLRQAAAVHILRAVGMYGAGLPEMEISEEHIRIAMMLGQM